MSTEKRQLTRANRGKRISELIGGEEKEEDKIYSSDIFAEEEDDNDFTAIEEEEDIVDADFDLPEEEEEDTGPTDQELRRMERKQKKTKNVYVDPRLKKTVQKKRTPRKKVVQTETPQKIRRSAREGVKKKTELVELRVQEREILKSVS